MIAPALGNVQRIDRSRARIGATMCTESGAFSRRVALMKALREQSRPILFRRGRRADRAACFLRDDEARIA
jgi:hypothetical protein